MSQANCGAYELCFYEADTGLFIPAASKLKVRQTDRQAPQGRSPAFALLRGVFSVSVALAGWLLV